MKTISEVSSITTASTTSTTVATTSGQLVIVATVLPDQTFTQPSQQVTVGEYPAGNSNWSRALRLTDQGFFCLRYGVGTHPVAILAAALTKIAVYLENSLTWAPKITTQPTDEAVVANGTNHADFVIVVSSELDVTYAWYESTDGVAWGSALTTAGIYNVATPGTLKITPTNGDLTKNGKKYKCVCTNGAGSTTSSIVTLTVTAS